MDRLLRSTMDGSSLARGLQDSHCSDEPQQGQRLETAPEPERLPLLLRVLQHEHQKSSLTTAVTTMLMSTPTTSTRCLTARSTFTRAPSCLSRLGSASRRNRASYALSSLSGAMARSAYLTSFLLLSEVLSIMRRRPRPRCSGGEIRTCG